MCIFQVSAISFLTILTCHTHATEIAREVVGGVELLSPGEVELIVPDELSFTVKSPGPFIGKAEFCYAAKTTVNRIFGYHNFVETCPAGTCVLLISDEHRAHGLITERRGSIVHYQYKDIGDTWCPRLVINGRQNFTILRLPQAPVIVNGASLPKNETASARIDTKWVIVICIVSLLLIFVVGFVGYCIFLHFKKKPAVKDVQQVSKSRKSHRLLSRVVISPIQQSNDNSV